MHALEIIKEMVHATQQMNVKKEMVLYQEHVQRVMEFAVSVSYFQSTVYFQTVDRAFIKFRTLLDPKKRKLDQVAWDY